MAEPVTHTYLLDSVVIDVVAELYLAGSEPWTIRSKSSKMNGLRQASGNNSTKHMKKFIILFWFIIIQIAMAEVRTWKTADGLKSIEAEFISTRDGEVTIKRKSDQRLFTLPISKLSEEDQTWIKTQKVETNTPEEVKEPDPALVKLIAGNGNVMKLME